MASNAVNAITSYKSFLMHYTNAAWSKLVDVKDTPDMGGDPEMLDATTQSDRSRVYKPGIDEAEALAFTSNYNLAEYNKLKALEGKNEKYALWLGGDENPLTGDVTPTGVDGKFEFEGDLRVKLAGAGVNVIRDMNITIAPSTPIIQTEGVVTLPSVELDTHAIVLTVGDTYTFRTATVPAGKSVSWSSSAGGKASVANGVVTALEAGTAIITATITDGGVDYTDTCTVIVEAAE